ncbi:iron uptake transporter deferrochelatase/peroxidase subunit [Actinomadura xylanilytica]|uniref:iron uptake transporter deferrochelatase/peroxidase subunit n=1 Tax=Actinomadura xylanilytica TaxID=887459 RepID=UPI00255B15E0|nr:iron uptake transporter deferrochelatase/peroxidase subunit [Actinomadura xylanilytica]MDL4772959.1 iron uptake transporter deferrochelatase/peroxidase subunit [Actinomadura xylanilytica]
MNESNAWRGISRRRLLGAAGGTGVAGLAAGGLAGFAGQRLAGDDGPPLTAVGATAVPFHGRHQAGITTPLQASGYLVAFDLCPGTGRGAVAGLMRRWTAAAAAMTAGQPPARDDHIALDAGPSSLTVTFGFGRSLFARIGLGDRTPAALVPVPPFPADALDPARSDGDLWVQIGADDPLVAAHALRVLHRGASGTARMRWQMSGFNRARGATGRPMTGRNLMGQVDGTGNPRPSDPGFDTAVFVAGGTGPHAWMNGGSYAVVRRIRMLLDVWEKLPLDRQERVIGRRKADGAPLSGGTETTPVDLTAVGPDGALAIPGDAHVRAAAPQSNNGATMLRRSFSYHDGLRPDGAPDAGLLFVAWQADPTAGFIQVQRKLDGADGLTRFLRHEASAIFAVPGGAAPGEYVGQRLLEP